MNCRAAWQRWGAVCALAAVLATLVVLGTAKAAHADPACQQGGAYVLFARGSGENFNDDRARAFQQYVMRALANSGVPSAWAELGDLDGVNGRDQNGYPAVRVESWQNISTANGAYYASVNTGVNELVTHLNDRYAGDGPTGGGSCSQETLVLGGYSQGAHVVGQALHSGLSQAARDRIGFVALYGDPRFNPGPLLDRIAHANFQNNWWWVRGDDPGYFASPFWPDSGVLGIRSPYVPGEFKGRFGSWCAAFDAVCTSFTPGMPIHEGAYHGGGGWIARSADEIAYVAKQKRDFLARGMPRAGVGMYTTVPNPVAAPQPVARVYQTADGTRLALPDGRQFIWVRGVTIPVNYNDAVQYDATGNRLQPENDRWAGPLNTVTPPQNMVFRAVGDTRQYLLRDGQKLPIGDPATSACLMHAFRSSNFTDQPAVVPASWAGPLPTGQQIDCSLADGTRFTQANTGVQQYVSIRGAVFGLSYDDALAYDGAGNPYQNVVMPAGYIENPIHATSRLPVFTVLHTLGGIQQFMWDGGLLRPIGDPGTSQCWLIAYPQNGVAEMPPSWMHGRAQGSAGLCSLADGTRFIEPTYSGTQQYVSVRGAALPLQVSDAQWYDANGNAAVISMAEGYVQNPIHGADRLPMNTVLRGTGSNAQYLWDGAQLHYIAQPSTSLCLLEQFPQNGVAVAPTSWLATLPVGVEQACS